MKAPRPKLSVVVIAYEMPRELPRTIRSLSPPMQLGIDVDEYELLVVDNGSSEPPDRAACEAFGARVRWLRMDDPSPSPAAAINRGIFEASGSVLGVMVDGARLASPGILRHALVGAELHPRPVIATLGFHLGPDLQHRAAAAGYDQDAEDALLAGVEWTDDGYRLFEISVLAGSSRAGWFEPPAESNALFMPAELWAEVGGYDEQFSSPGGGFLNLDLFERACRLPDTRLVVLLGEGTFHQIHGGAATRSPATTREEFAAEYLRVRGREFEKPAVRPLYVGTPSRHALPGIAASAREDGPAIGSTGALARRYTKLLKKALLNMTGLEAEAAYFQLRDAVESGEAVDPAVASDVRARAPDHLRELRLARGWGHYFRVGEVGFPHTMVGRARLDNIERCITTALFEHVPGDLVECGVWRGGASILMRGVLAAWNVSDRTVWVADSFAGLPKPEHGRDTLDLSAERAPELAVSQKRVAANFKLFDLLDDQVRFLEGFFRDTLPEAPIEAIAVLRLDGDLYESTMTSLVALYDRVSPGGFVIIDDYRAVGACREAVDEFRAERGITDPLVEVDWTEVYWRKAR